MKKNASPDYLHNPRCIGVECLAFNVRKAARVLAKTYDEALAPVDIKGTQFSILVGLSALGPIAMQEFAEVQKMDRTTLTRNLGPLARRGLVRTASGRDRRAKLLELTDEGRALLGEAVPLWEALQNRLVGAMGEAETANLRGALKTLSRIAEGQ